MKSNGGVLSADEVVHQPVTTILSGPAAGALGAALVTLEAGFERVLTLDGGGTSTDVSVVLHGEPGLTTEGTVGAYPCKIPMIDIVTVGAGGGSVAWLSPEGSLKVGPRSAGADPGPLCYGRGGVEPTVTDAHLVLGRLKPGPYAGGSVALDRDLAVAAIRSRIAERLGLSVEAAAAGIIRLVEQSLLHAVERISVQRGHNPRRFMLVACGGAGPMHGASVGRRLGCKAVYVPRQAGAFCALGMLHSDVRQDFIDVHFQDLDSIALHPIEDRFRTLEQRARELLTAEGFAAADTVTEREIDLRRGAEGRA
jgi:N-methylhydantoinase A